MIDRGLIVSGTDTNVGKTVLSALLMSALPDYSYWKPIQAGLLDDSDTECVRKLSGCDALRILPEQYVFANPLSPHAASQLEGVRVDTEALLLPSQSLLIIEGAGGLLVPLNENTLFIDIFKRWELPVLLSCRSGLGTINHTLLSIEALHNRSIPLLGVVMIGDHNISNERAIEHYSDASVIGRIPNLPLLTSETLREVYRTEFQRFETALIA
jgi:dethiobiotin synthetase